MNERKIKINANLSELDKLRLAVNDFCKVHNVEGKIVYYISLAIEEAFVNLIKYSFDFDSKRLVYFSFEVEENEIKIIIEDDGKSFDPRTVLPIENEQIKKKHTKGGFGIFLISQIMDKIDYFPKDKNSPTNKLILTKILE
ncbi:MAG: ATP-binding protein [Ignavibacteria bacterium]|nr:ATP-binding protein [Ignavibacteria bacterium]